MIKKILLLASVLLIVGCGPSREEIKKEVEAEMRPKIENELKTENADFVDYIKKKAKLEKIDIEPRKGESKLDALIRERQDTVGEIEKTKNEIREKEKLISDGETKLKALDGKIKQAEQDRLRFWALLVGGITAGLAIICGVISFLTSSYPYLPKVFRYCGIGLGIVSGLCFGFAALVPYLTVIGISLLALICLTGVFFWMKDRKSLVQVVEAVDENKDQITDFKDKFGKIVTEKSHIDSVKESIKKAKERAKAKIKTLLIK